MLLLTGLLATLAAAWCAYPLRVGNDLETLLRGHASYATYQRSVEAFGSDESVVVLYRSGGLSRDSVLELDRIVRSLRQRPEVARLASLLDLIPEAAVADRGALEEWLGRTLSLGRLAETVERTRLARGRLASRDLGVFAIVVWLDIPAGGGPGAEHRRREACAGLRAGLAAVFGSRPYHFIGYPVIEDRVLELVGRSNGSLMPLAILAGCCILAAVFRSVSLVLAAMAVILGSLVWTAATFRLGDYTLNVFSTMLFPLLLTVGLTTTVYVVSAYLAHEQTGGGQDGAPPELAVFPEVVPPTPMCTTTTFIGFLSLAWTDVPEIRNFGIYDALGTLLCLTAVMLFVPPAFRLLGPRRVRRCALAGSSGEPPELARRRLDRDRLGPRLAAIVRRVTARPGRIVAGFALLALLGVAGLHRLPVESASIRGLYEHDPVIEARRHFEESFGPLFAVELLVRRPDGRGFLELEGVRSLQRLQAALEAVPGVASTLSPADLLLDAASFVAKAPKTALATDREVALMARFYDAAERGGLMASYLADGDTMARVRVAIRKEGSLEILALAGDLTRAAASALPPGSTTEATGRNLLSAIVHRDAMANELSSFALAVSAILVVMGLVFGSVRAAIVASVPNLAPLLLTYGLMGWFGIPFNVVTGMIPCILIGLFVDDTIHYFFRYRELRRRVTSPALAARLTTWRTGRAMCTSALVLTAGLLVMAFSQFRMTMQFGVCMALAVALGVLVEVLLTPALLTLLPSVLAPKGDSLRTPTSRRARGVRA